MGKSIIKPRYIIYALVIVVVVGVVYKYTEPPKPTPLADVYETCLYCGMTREEITGIIESIRASSRNLSRQESLALYRVTFEDDGVEHDPADKALCDGCANSILDLVYGPRRE